MLICGDFMYNITFHVIYIIFFRLVEHNLPNDIVVFKFYCKSIIFVEI